MVFFLELVTHIVEASYYRSSLNLDVYVVSCYHYSSVKRNIFDFRRIHIRIYLSCREFCRLRIVYALFTGFLDCTPFAELNESVTADCGSFHRDNVTCLEVVLCSIIRVNLRIVFLKYESLEIGCHDKGSSNFKFSSDFSFEHVFDCRCRVRLFRNIWGRLFFST